MMMTLVGAALAAKVTVPVDVGVGPYALVPNNPMMDQQMAYGALSVSVEAIINKKVIQQNKKKIPKKYRSMLKGVDEVRISPSIFIPDTLILSPAVNGSAMYGISWEPLSLGTPLVSKKKFDWGASAGAVLTYAYITQPELFNGPMHFIRPGVSLETEAEIKLNKTWLVSFGWQSVVYLPQDLGASPASIPSSLDDAIWHLGGPFLKLHYRFPYTVKI